MKNLLVFLLLSIQFYIAFPQNNLYTHPTTVQAFYSLSGFKTPSSVSNTMMGFGLSLTKGLQPHLDWNATINVSKGDSIMKIEEGFNSKQLFIEADISFRWRLLQPKEKYQPFFISGLGISDFKNYLGEYLYAGAGFEFNVLNKAYVVLNAQRRLRLSNTLTNHNFFSIGLALPIPERKKPDLAVKTIPVVVPVKVSDLDNDGIPDSIDACPEQAGLKEFMGCPDSDHDSIPDNLDKCPTVPGIAKYNGCPIPDTDGDGVNDEEDQCPNVPGSAKYHGCPIPDTDGDGVNDEEDSCINEPGLRELHGCPAIKKEITKKMEHAAGNILFKTGSHQLLSSSYIALDTVVKTLMDDSDLKLDIEGYTDNTGPAQFNKQLSAARAKSIFDYLVIKGIDPARLNYTGYGIERPVASNKTEAGRAKNRRVELKLKY